MAIKLKKLSCAFLFAACVWISGCASENPEETRQEAEQLQETQQMVKSGEIKEAPEPEETPETVRMPKYLSVMGDSISTFETWIPEGYYDFYPGSGDVADVNQTWWKMVIDDMDMELCANASSAGSTCIGDSLGVDNPQHGCSDFRIADLMGKKGTYPDIIIVYMGTNDFLVAAPLGDNDGTQYVEEGDIENFSDAYGLILDKLSAQYPGADIFCCTLTPIGDWGTKREFEMMVNGDGLTSEEYSRQIEVIAAAKGCQVIDLYNCGITIDNMSEYVSDGVHLKPDGMALIRDAVEAAITDFYH